MGNEYYPAIITAIAGIIGIFLNFGVNTISKTQELYEKRNELKLKSLETYYIPLSNKMQNLSRILSVFEVSLNTKVDGNKLIRLFNGKERVPAGLKKVFEELKKAIEEIHTWIQSDQYNYLGDYKLRYLYDDLYTAIMAFHQTIATNTSILVHGFNIKSIDKLVKRIISLSLLLYSKNIFHSLYLKLWAMYVKNKQ